HRSSRQILRFAQDKLWIYRCGRAGFDACLDGAMCLLCETRRRCGRIESANPFSMVWLRSLLCSVLRCTPSFFEACVTLPRLAVIAATMYLPSNASTACSSVMPFPINSRMIAFRRSSILTIRFKTSAFGEVVDSTPRCDRECHNFLVGHERKFFV